MVLGYIDFARNPAARGNSSPVALLIVIVSSFVLDRELLLAVDRLSVVSDLMDARRMRYDQHDMSSGHTITAAITHLKTSHLMGAHCLKAVN